MAVETVTKLTTWGAPHEVFSRKPGTTGVRMQAFGYGAHKR